MKITRSLTFITIALLIFIIIDIFIRIRYCTNVILQFNSSEFNNILTPIISFFGFIAVIITIWIALGQKKSKESEYYFKDYQTKINIIEREKESTGTWTNHDFLDFIKPIQSDVDSILTNSEYLSDLNSFRNGLNTTSDNKSYDRTLSVIRLFKIEARILYKSILYLIKEIEQHRFLTNTHKDLLLNIIVDRLISSYLSNCHLIKEKVINWEDDFYIGFYGNISDNYNLKMFNKGFFELYDYVINSRLVKYYHKEF